MSRHLVATEFYNYENTTDLSTELSKFDEYQTTPTVSNSQIVNYVYLVYSPVLITFGTIGNLMSVFVFFNSNLRYHPTSQYLSALALSDTVFLLQLIPPWLSTTQDIQLFYTGGYCQFFVYISYVSSCLSAWLIVVFTIERAVVVTYPLSRSTFCTLRRARYIIISLTIASAIVNLPILQFAAPDTYECGIDRKYLYFATRFNIVDSAINFTVPMGLIICINSWIMCAVCKIDKERLEMLKEESEQNQVRPQVRPQGRPVAPNVTSLQYPRGQQRITRTLLIVSSTYVILNLPAYGIRFVAYGFRENAVDIMENWVVLQQISALCFHTNFGINFFLYCFNGRNFREALIQAIPYLRYRAQRAEAARRAAFALAPANSISTSIGSNGTELASVVTVQPPPRREPDVIMRWKFNNKRQQPGQPGHLCQPGHPGHLCQPGQPGQPRQLGQPGPSRITNIEPIEMDVARDF